MKNMNDKQRTYMLMTVPILILFFLFINVMVSRRAPFIGIESQQITCAEQKRDQQK